MCLPPACGGPPTKECRERAQSPARCPVGRPGGAVAVRASARPRRGRVRALPLPYSVLRRVFFFYISFYVVRACSLHIRQRRAATIGRPRYRDSQRKRPRSIPPAPSRQPLPALHIQGVISWDEHLCVRHESVSC